VTRLPQNWPRLCRVLLKFLGLRNAGGHLTDLPGDSRFPELPLGNQVRAPINLVLAAKQMEATTNTAGPTISNLSTAIVPQSRGPRNAKCDNGGSE
jgi:hypothetical protein